MLNAYLDAYRGLPRPVWMVSLILLINRSGTMVLPFWALYCTSERSLTVAQAGVLLAVFGVGGIFGSISGGLLSNRIGPVPVMIGSLALSAVGFIGLMIPEELPGMAVAMFALAIFTEAMRPAAATATAASCDPTMHPRAMALNRLAINLGMAVGPAIGGLLATWSFRLLFLCDAATCAVAAAASVVLLRDVISETDAEHEATTANGASALTDVPMLAALCLLFLAGLVFFQFLGTWPLYLRDHYLLREYHIGILMSVNTVVIVLCEMVLVRYVERFNQLRVVAWGCFLACAGFGMIRFGSTMWFAVLTVLIWTLGEMLSSPLAVAFVTARASPSNRGTYLALYTTCFSLAAVAAPVWGTWTYERDPNLLWNSCFAAAFVTFGGFWALARCVAPEPMRSDADQLSVAPVAQSLRDFEPGGRRG